MPRGRRTPEPRRRPEHDTPGIKQFVETAYRSARQGAGPQLTAAWGARTKAGERRPSLPIDERVRAPFTGEQGADGPQSRHKRK